MRSGRPIVLVAGFIASLGALGLLAWFNWRHAARSLEMAQLVAHTHLVQATLNRLEALVKDIESGGRGYVLTGDLGFLSSFEASLSAMKGQEQSLDELVRDPEQRIRLTALEARIAERVELSRSSVRLRRESGFAAALEMVRRGHGKAAMDDIHAQFAEMNEREEVLLDGRTSVAAREASMARRLTLAGTLMSFTLLIAVFTLMLRENRLRQRSEAELDRFFTLSLDMLCITNADGYFKRLSPAFTQTLGWSVDEILARPFLDFVHPDDKPATLREVERQVVGGETVLQFENRYRHKDGSFRVLSWKSVPQPGGFMYATARDVTEARRAQQELSGINAELHTQTSQLEVANKELESFAYSVSHDLRTPLRAIDGFGQAILEDYAGALDPKGQDYLRRIRAGAQRMGQLIDDLLTLSKVTRSEMVFAEVDLTALALRVVADLRAQAGNRDVTWDIGPGLTARGDARLLQIVLENLLANALKFTSRCEHTHIAFGEETREGARVFFVRDNGAGFDMAHAGRLFGPFQRLHTAQEFPGTGIGLATVQRIIHRHGGRIWAEGRPGNGATFSFTLRTPLRGTP